MTQDERRMLSELADKIAQTPAPPRDPEAEDFIRTRIGNRPDALYLMTQTVLIQNMALQQAQQQLRTQGSGAGASSGSFLGGQPQSAPPPQNPQQYAPLQPQYTQPLPNSGGAPSFLRGAAQTAAGVAAGALAFEGIQSLFSHPGYGGMDRGFGGFGGAGYGGGYGGGPAEETVVNNYYDNGGVGGGNDDLQLQDARDDFSGGDDSFSSGDSGFDDSGSDDNFS